MLGFRIWDLEKSKKKQKRINRDEGDKGDKSENNSLAILCAAESLHSATYKGNTMLQTTGSLQHLDSLLTLLLLILNILNIRC